MPPTIIFILGFLALPAEPVEAMSCRDCLQVEGQQESTTHVQTPDSFHAALGSNVGSSSNNPSRPGRDVEMTGWRGALSRWVNGHAYYPKQAFDHSEQGDPKVHVTVSPDGRVKSVQLVRKSGSKWLDLAAVALFRDQHIPSLPPDTPDPFEFDFVMHYYRRAH